MPTVKELSVALGVSGQTIRNYVKTEFGMTPQKGKALVFTDEQASIISNHFSKPTNPDFEKEHTELRHENELLKQRVDDLEKMVRILEEQLQTTNEALEREQNISRGFWSRLGRKLLGDGK